MPGGGENVVSEILGAVEYWAEDFMNTDNPFVEWGWHQSVEGQALNAVVGWADLLAIDGNGRERTLRATQWLGRLSAEVVTGYGIRDLRKGPLMAWNRGSTQLSEVTFINPRNLRTRRPDFAALGYLAAMLGSARPINSKPFEPLKPDFGNFSQYVFYPSS